MTARGRVTAALRIFCIAAAGGCSSDGGSAAPVTARDTLILHRGTEVTVQIVESDTDNALGSAWHLDDVPELSVGSDASAETSLFRVRGAYRLADGRIVVADGGSTQLKIFDGAGRLDTIVGGAGDGPGEFRSITWFGRLPGDSLFVWDLGLARVTVFDPSGALLGEFRNATTSSVTGVFADGSLLARGFVNLSGRTPSGLERHQAAVLHLAPDGTLADSLGTRAGGEGFFVPLNGGFSVYTPPFARTTEIVAAGDRLYVTDTGRSEVRVLAPDGRPLRLVRWLHTTRPVGAAEIERARQHALEDSRDEQHRPNIERMFRDMPMPDAMPASGSLLVDRDANIWVQRYRTPWDEGESEWIVFGRDGGLIAEIAMPAAFSPTDIGTDYVLGIARDDMDVEHVRLYRLQRS